MGTQIPNLFGLGTNASAGILGAASGIAGAFPTPTTINGSGTATTNSWSDAQANQNTFSNQQFQQLLDTLSRMHGVSSTQANLSPQAQALINQLTQSYQRFTQPVDLSGYQSQQIQGINQNSNIASQAANNIMASRGLSSSPVAATTASNIDANRIAQINNLNQSLPLLANQLNLANLGQAGQFATSVPYGTTTMQDTTNTGSQNTSGTSGTTAGGTSWNGVTGGTHTEQQQQQATKTGGGIAGAIGGIASTLAGLFSSDARLKKEIHTLTPKDVTEKIMRLRPVEWSWKKDSTKDMGVLAQDLRKVVPELVHKDPEGSGYLKVNYAGLIPLLIGAVQDLNERVEAK